MAVLDFEETIVELQEKRAALETAGREQGEDYSEEIRILTHNIERLQKRVFKKLTSWQVVQLSRHPDRPHAMDYIGRIVQNWIPFHGDRAFGDDPAILTGFGRIDGQTLCVIAQQKGRTTKEKVKHNFGMPHPEGYRKALRVMKLAERFGIPILTLIDTPGAAPGLEDENRSQCCALSDNLMAMSQLKTPIISVIIGEGGSGGALAIGLADVIMMLEYSIYSVISPESCAVILWKDGSAGPRAAELLKVRAADAEAFGLIDGVIKEPVGGAHNDPEAMALALKKNILKSLAPLRALCQKNVDDLLTARFDKWRAYGQFEQIKEAAADAVRDPCAAEDKP